MLATSTPEQRASVKAPPAFVLRPSEVPAVPTVSTAPRDSIWLPTDVPGRLAGAPNDRVLSQEEYEIAVQRGYPLVNNLGFSCGYFWADTHEQIRQYEAFCFRYDAPPLVSQDSDVFMTGPRPAWMD